MAVAGLKGAIRSWWAENPMCYGNRHGTATYDDGRGGTVEAEFGSEAFFDRADDKFYRMNVPLHGAGAPFSRIFPYERMRGKRVLEVGCGMGCMAMNWARQGARVSAVDLNEVAVRTTRRRFETFRLEGDVRPADAHDLPFPDGAFDYAWSWGVLHHSPDLDRSIDELFRVLRPGGGFGVMLYHRRSLRQAYSIRYLEGFLHGESRFLDARGLASRYSDGAAAEGNPHTWPVTRPEMRRLFSRHSADVRIRVLGTDLDAGPMKWLLPLPKLLWVLPRFALKPWGRRFGWSLWIHGTKAVSP